MPRTADLEHALDSAIDTILLTGGNESEKLQVLESLWTRPPSGFAPIPVPCRDATSSEIAARILAITRTTPVRDAEASLARMIRTQSIRGLRPLFLLDDLEALPLAALARLRSIADGSRVAVRWVAVGSDGGASAAALDLLPRPVRVIAIDIPESPPRAAASSEPAEVLERVTEPPRAPTGPPPAGDPPPAARPIRVGVPAPAPPRPPAVRPVSHEAPPRLPPPRRARRARRLSAGERTAIVSGILACAAVALVVARGPAVASWATQAADASLRSASALMADTRSAVADTWSAIGAASASLASSATSGGRRIASATVTTAERAIERARAYTTRDSTVRELPEAPPAVAAAPEAVRRRPAVAAAPPPAPAAPIQVGINSDPWSNVAVDGIDLGSTPVSVSLSPGPHRFRAEMADGRIVEREIVVAERRREIVFR